MPQQAGALRGNAIVPGPLFVETFWGAWAPTTEYVPPAFGIPASFYANYQHRFPPHFAQPNGPAMWSASSPGSVDTAAIVAVEVAVRAGAANAHWIAFLNRLNRPVYIIGVGAVSTAAWTAARCVGGFVYGINGGNPSPGSVQHSWSEQQTKNDSNFGQPGFVLMYNHNFTRDPRGRQGDPASTGWSDIPSIPDQEADIHRIIAANARIICVGQGGELDEEGGGLTPTAEHVSSTFPI